MTSLLFSKSYKQKIAAMTGIAWSLAAVCFIVSRCFQSRRCKDAAIFIMHFSHRLSDTNLQIALSPPFDTIATNASGGKGALVSAKR